MVVQLFGPLAEQAGTTRLEIRCAQTTVGEIVQAAARALPSLRLEPSVRFALNAEYAEASAAVREGDVVSLIPPVGGG